MTAPLAELIARLEAAAEGSRDLDYEILRAAFPEIGFHIEPAVPALLMNSRLMATTKSGMVEHVSLPEYTALLDAALTLVPEGWFWRVGRTSLFQAWAGVYQTHPDNGERDLNEFYWHRDHGAPPSTPALALCIAALKARATAEPQR